MKKIKLITSLSTLATISAVVPALATSCNSKDDKKEEEKTLGAKIDNVPTQLEKGTESNPCAVTATYGNDSIKIDKAEVTSDANNITGVWDKSNQTITFKASANASLGPCVTVVTMTTEDNQVWTHTYNISITDVPAVKINTMTYDGQNYELKDNIDPNIFCGAVTSLPLRDGTPLPVDQAKITKLALINVDQSTTIINDDFMLQFTGLESIDLRGLENIETIGKWCFAQCSSLQSVDLSPLVKVSSVGEEFLWHCDNLTSVNFGIIKPDAFSDEDKASFTTNVTTAKCYTQGIKFFGEYFYELGFKFPNSDVGSGYRNIIALNRMTYNSTEYVLAKNIDPNLFATADIEGFNYFYLKQWIPVINNGEETKIVIGGSADEWAKLSKLIITSADSSVTGIHNGFLFQCNGLTKLDLYGIKNIKAIGDYFCSFNNSSITTIDMTPFVDV